MRDQIEKFALQNAIKFEGKANLGAVIGQMFGHNPKLRQNAKELSKEVNEIIKKVNSMSLEEQRAKLEKIAPEMLKEKKHKQKRKLPELPNVTNKFVTRIPPEPSKFPHLGHALSFLINYMYAEKYKGKCVLRLDDTNPEKVKEEYYQAVYDALLWLRIKVDKTLIASNEMEAFYKYAEQLINEGNAYVCFCDKEKMRHFRTQSKICEHREQNPRQAGEHWQDMMSKLKPGEAVLRMKGDMDSMNAVLRDPVLFRITEEPHPMQGTKYRVWPMYDFETAVAEHICGVTHILRSNEFGTMRTELQNRIKDLLGLPKQEVKEYGRFNVVGAVTKGREIREMIEKGEVTGWDDPRLVTLTALKRRGIVPDALYEVVLDAGMSPNQTNIDWSVIAAANRKVIDPVAKRYFFVKNPRVVKLDQPLEEVEVPLHPENDIGVKRLKLREQFYVSDEIDPHKAYRFMHMFNFMEKKYISKEYDLGLKAKIIHAVPFEEAIDVQVLMDDGTYVEGKGERALKDLEEGEIVQFERLFFCRLDNKEKMIFIFTHY